MRLTVVVTSAFAAALAVAPLVSRAADDATSPPISFSRDLRPLLNANCNACHKPDKSKAELDMTTYASLIKGSKKGPVVVAGEPAKSKLLGVCTGPDAEMPPDGEGKPLTGEQLAVIDRWIRQGAKDDTPAPGASKVALPTYTVAPPVTSMAWSPDGSVLAVSGYHEVVLHKGDGTGVVARLVGEAPRVESVAFSKDGALIGVAGGAPGEFGQVQIWDAKTHQARHTYQPSPDSLYGLSFAPDGKTVAVGGADKVARRIEVDTGKVVTDFRAHADWVLATTFTLDGKQMVTGGRDKAMKLVDVETGRFVDDINNPVEQVLCMTRHPSQEQILYGGDLGVARLYKISDNQGRTSGRIDTNLLVTFERLPAPVTSAAFSPDGSKVALGTTNEVRVYDAKGATPSPEMQKPAAAKAATGKPARPGRKPAAAVGQTKAALQLEVPGGPIFALAFKPDGTVLTVGGSDGKVRLFDAKAGELVTEFSSVPLKGK